jgi:hypothetical protein
VPQKRRTKKCVEAAKTESKIEMVSLVTNGQTFIFQIVKSREGENAFNDPFGNCVKSQGPDRR